MYVSFYTKTLGMDKETFERQFKLHGRKEGKDVMEFDLSTMHQWMHVLTESFSDETPIRTDTGGYVTGIEVYDGQIILKTRFFNNQEVHF